MTLRMGFYESYVYLTDVGKGFGLAFSLCVKGSSLSVCGTQHTDHHLYRRSYYDRPVAGKRPVYQLSGQRKRAVSDDLLPSLCNLHHCHRPGVPVAVPLRLWLHQPCFKLFGLPPQKWLSDPNLTTISVTIFTIWNGMAFKIVLFLAGLQKIDPQYYQAARMDETPPSRVFFRITMPLLSSTFWMVTIVSVIHAFKTYNEVYSMFGGNGPAPETVPLPLFTISTICFSTVLRCTTHQPPLLSFSSLYWR